MKGSTGTPLGTYGAILPGAVRIARIHCPSRQAANRLRWMDHYRKHGSVALTCRHFGIGRSLFYKWQSRYEQLGLKGLETRSRKPLTVRHREIPLPIQAKIEKLRREYPAWSKYKLSVILARDHGTVVSPSSINRIFHDRNLFWASPLKRSKAARKGWRITRVRTPIGLKGLHPGSVVEIDHKVLNNLGQVFYQFTAIDTCTRLKFIRVYSRKTAHVGQLFVEALVGYCPFTVKCVQSDNGGEFLAECHDWLNEHSITHCFSRPRTPKDNPHVEATIKADEYEFWAWGNLATTVGELNVKADQWMETFNAYRPHQSLNYLTPQAFYETHYANK